MDTSWSTAANRNLIWLFVVTWFLLAGCGEADGQKCRFPSEWKGRWWQSGLGDVIMRDSSMSTKGQCHEHHRDYYLLYNRERQCYSCLLIMERHRNLIQYKESFCSDEGSLEKICQMIRVESPLYSLVREPNAHIRCPFRDAYYFNYNDHHSGFCDNPLSYAKPCVGHHQYQLHFQHCVNHAELNGRDLELECLATWKEGSDTYLYGRFSGPGIMNKDSAYRCFKYDYEGNQLLLSMSLDPTCRGLRSARDGPVIFKFTKDLNGWPPPVCQFPEWFRGENWRDIEGRNSYELDDKSREIMGYYRKRINSKSHMKYQFRCMEVIEDDLPNQQMTFLSFSTHRCVSKHQCIRLRKIKDGVVEMFLGSLVDYDGNTRCLQEGEYHTRQILIPDSQPLTPCPNPGFYDIQPSVKCHLNLDIGCSNSSSIELLTSCIDDPDYYHIGCLAWWQAEDRTFIIAQDKMAQSRLYNCFSIRRRGAIVEFGVDNNCNRGIPNLYDSSIRHTIIPLGHCSAKPVRPTPRITSTTPRTTQPTTIIDDIDIASSSQNPVTKPPRSTIYSEDDFNFVDGADPSKDQSGWMQDSDKHPVVPDPDNYPYLPENKDDLDDSEEESSAKISIESPVDYNELSSGDGRPPDPDDPASIHSSSVSRSTNSAQALHNASNSMFTVIFLFLLILR